MAPPPGSRAFPPATTSQPVTNPLVSGALAKLSFSVCYVDFDCSLLDHVIGAAPPGGGAGELVFGFKALMKGTKVRRSVVFCLDFEVAAAAPAPGVGVTIKMAVHRELHASVTLYIPFLILVDVSCSKKSHPTYLLKQF